MKFKVGDRVVGNKKATCNYGVTREGWMGEVIKVIKDNLGEHLYVRALPGFRGNTDFVVRADCFDLVEKAADRKIIISTDGVKTTAQMYCGKERVKSAEAKCSPSDEFDFETGAALAMDRLLGKDAKETESSVTETKPFSLTYLSSGRFGYTNRDMWFVVVEGRLVYVENGEGWDDIANLNADGTFASGHRIDFVVDAYSLGAAKNRVRTGNYIWQRNK